MERTPSTRFLEYQEFVLQDMKDLTKWDFYLARLCYEIYSIRVGLGGGEPLLPEDFLMFADKEGKPIDPYTDVEVKVIKEKKILVYKPPPPLPRGIDGKPILDEATKASMEKSKRFWGKALGMDPKTMKPLPKPEKVNLAGNSPEDVAKLRKAPKRRRL